jgi:hypothetical protein
VGVVLALHVTLHAKLRPVSCAQKARKQREEAKQRKEENQRKSMVVQAVTNPKTLKKMMASKKERKKLMKADTLKSVG